MTRVPPWFIIATLMQPWLAGCAAEASAPESAEPRIAEDAGSWQLSNVRSPTEGYEGSRELEGFTDCFGPVPMTPPKRLSGRTPRYTPEALAQRVEGLVIARCRITRQGKAKDCRLVKSLPHMEAEVLDALHGSRYEPAMFQGKPTEMDYVLHFRFKLPNQDAPADAGTPKP